MRRLAFRPAILRLRLPETHTTQPAPPVGLLFFQSPPPVGQIRMPWVIVSPLWATGKPSREPKEGCWLFPQDEDYQPGCRPVRDPGEVLERSSIGYTPLTNHA